MNRETKDKRITYILHTGAEFQSKSCLSMLRKDIKSKITKILNFEEHSKRKVTHQIEISKA